MKYIKYVYEIQEERDGLKRIKIYTAPNASEQMYSEIHSKIYLFIKLEMLTIITIINTKL